MLRVSAIHGCRKMESKASLTSSQATMAGIDSRKNANGKGGWILVLLNNIILDMSQRRSVSAAWIMNLAEFLCELQTLHVTS